MATKAKTRKAKQKELTTLEKALKEKSPSLAEGDKGGGYQNRGNLKPKTSTTLSQGEKRKFFKQMIKIAKNVKI